jgi:acyl-CoA synthetase (NDP forming)
MIAIAYPGFIQIEQEEVLKPLLEQGIPVYPTPERALRAYARMLAYYKFHATH